MRRLVLALLLPLLLLSAPAKADRVMEVQNVTVSGVANREAAVDQATQQAAQQVWTQLGRTTPLPALTPAQLQSIASYVDVASETARQNYYAGTFNVGIQVNALLHAAGGGTAPLAQGNVVEDSGDAYRPGQPAQQATAPHHAPGWILIITGRELADQVQLWNATDAWSQAWQRAPMTGISTAVATGDASDQSALPATLLQDYSPDLADRMHRLASKYGAPAVAVVLLNSQRAEIGVNEEIKVEVAYLEKDMPEVQTAQATLFVTASTNAAAFSNAVTEGQKLIAQMADGSGMTQAAQNAVGTLNYTGPVGAQAGQFGNSYTGAAPAATATNKLWVRIPLTTPADLANYRRKIESIPGARFEIIALNRMYVEGNILYAGDQNTLMQQLANAGLRQQ